MSTTNTPFHLAFPVADLEKTRLFYADLLGCEIGRESDRWIDFNFFGHQITAHLSDQAQNSSNTNLVDGENVPVRHFGAILEPQEWRALADKLNHVGTQFVIAPTTRFAGQVGEQSTMFFYDPSGNALEFKAFANKEMIFAR